MELENLIYIRKKLFETEWNESGITGKMSRVGKEEIKCFKTIGDNIEEVKTLDGEFYFKEDYDKLLGKDIFISIKTGNYSNYFENFQEFLRNQKFEKTLEGCYIHSSTPDEEARYNNNILLIELLREIADFEREIGNDLELFFHQTQKSLILNMDYSIGDLAKSQFESGLNFIQDFRENVHWQERKLIFTNELLNFFEQKEQKNYSHLLTNWETFRFNFYRSYSLYLEGFSFDKIKTSSLAHFQDLSEKINETIRKVASYLFAIPIAFLFLISRFDFTGSSHLNNASLLLLGYLFYILIYKIFFKNLEESLDSIKHEIRRFTKSIETISTLTEVKSELNKLEQESLKKQYNKLKLLENVTLLIVALMTLVFFLVHRRDITLLVYKALQ